MPPRFDEWLAFVLDREGGYVDDPQDHGGATNRGVTQRVYDQFRDTHGLPRQPVRAIGDDEVRLVYLASYWRPMHCDQVFPPLDLVLFDAAIQHGVSGATRLLQRALHIAEDGVFGPATLRGTQSVGATLLAGLVVNEREAYYAKIIRNDPSQHKYENGWNNRIAALETAAGLA